MAVERILQVTFDRWRQEAVVLKIQLAKPPEFQLGNWLTIGSDCKIPETKSEEAEGVARRARIMFAPELCPARVILLGFPPKLGRTFCRNWRLVITSLRPRLVFPFGARRPSCTRNQRNARDAIEGRLTTPRRYWITATTAPVDCAKSEPSRPGALAPPSVNDPP